VVSRSEYRIAHSVGQQTTSRNPAAAAAPHGSDEIDALFGSRAILAAVSSSDEEELVVADEAGEASNDHHGGVCATHGAKGPFAPSMVASLKDQFQPSPNEMVETVGTMKKKKKKKKKTTTTTTTTTTTSMPTQKQHHHQSHASAGAGASLVVGSKPDGATLTVGGVGTNKRKAAVHVHDCIQPRTPRPGGAQAEQEGRALKTKNLKRPKKLKSDLPRAVGATEANMLDDVGEPRGSAVYQGSGISLLSAHGIAPAALKKKKKKRRKELKKQGSGDEIDDIFG
jgi:hypothetical protein